MASAHSECCRYVRDVAEVRIHCYGGCGASTLARPDLIRSDLASAGWADFGGQTYCPRCATERGLTPHEPAPDPTPEERHGKSQGCLVDVAIAVVLFVLLGLLAGDYHHANGSVSIHLTTGPTLVFVALLLAYWFFYRRPRRQDAGTR